MLVPTEHDLKMLMKLACSWRSLYLAEVARVLNDDDGRAVWVDTFTN